MTEFKLIPVNRPFIGDEELSEIKEVFESRWLGLGSKVKEFEDKVCEYLHAPRFLATNTGTTALHLALRTLGVGRGDEVIVPSFTFVATIQAITASGAEPVFCDISEKNLNIDVTKIQALITKNTKIIIPVHYRGVTCDMDELLNIAESNHLYLIEDAAHAFGSYYHQKKIGSFGHVTCFSFDPIKNITCGEGGGIVFHDPKHHELAEKMRILGIDKDTWSRYHNKRSWQYDVVCEGYRYHMPNFCAAIGLKQLDKCEMMRAHKAAICKKYDEAFANVKKVSILETDYDEIFPFMYIVLAKNRDEFIAYLASKGVGTGIHYLPAHEFSLYQDCKKDDLRVTDKISKMNTTLPLYYEMTDEIVNKIIQAVLDYEKEN